MAFAAGPRRCFPVKVVTMDADLAMDIEVRKQNVERSSEPAQFHFLVKYYPESVEEELIQETTKHLFFLQVMASVVSGSVYCPAEASVLLASYAAQARAGDAAAAEDLRPPEFLPPAVIGQYHMTPDMWAERIRTWWLNNKGMTREEAEMEYLKIAQDLDQYGTHFFPIFNKKESNLWLGVCATGVHIYTEENRLVPEIRFQWKEILNISFRNKKLVIKVTEENVDGKSKHWVAWTESMEACQVVLDLCVGSHNLYLRRRKADSVEVQAMKAQAREASERRAQERARLQREQEDREAAEEEREALRAALADAQAQLRAQSEILARSEGTAELLAEKARLGEEEALALAKRAAEAESEARRLGLAHLRSREERLAAEQQAREAQALAQQLLADNRRPATVRLDPPDPPLPGPDPSSAADIRSLSAQMERERAEYAQKSRHLQSQLHQLRNEIEGLKVEEGQSDLDRIYLDNQKQGQNKYASLRKNDSDPTSSSSGTTKARIEAFDGL